MRKLLIGLAVLAVLVVGADRAGAWFVTRQIESQATQDASPPAHAQVHGFPFLTQLATGDLDRVQLSADSTRLEEQDLRINDVQVQAWDVTRFTGPQARVGRLEVTGIIPFDDLARRIGLPPGSISAVEGGHVRVAQNVQLLGVTLNVGAVSQLRVDDDVVVVEPFRLELEGSQVELDEQLRASLLDRLVQRLELSDLPTGMRLEGVEVVPQGVRVRLSGRDVPLSELTGSAERP